VAATAHIAGIADVVCTAGAAAADDLRDHAVDDLW
jgi:hypothetical protein